MCASQAPLFGRNHKGFLSPALAPNSALQGSKFRSNLVATSELERDASDQILEASPPILSFHHHSQKMTTIPFLPKDQLNGDLDAPDTERTCLPGNPRIRLDDPLQLNSFINKDFGLGDLERLAPHLWLMSKHDGGNISPLHRQFVKGRRIVMTEDIRLHLVWYYDRIFIKPLSQYITSHAFWSEYLVSSQLSPSRALNKKDEIHKTALGYLRTYSYLITHESDFYIAQEQHLIPKGVTWTQLSNFMMRFGSITDDDVARRFHYGELRLTRLNFYSRLILHKRNFQRVHSQYGSYFAAFYGPLLFTFATLSLLLNAMQVEMAVEQVNLRSQWLGFWDVCRGFSVTCLVLVIMLSLWLAVLFLYKFVMEWVYALSQQRMRKASNLTA
jgi:hypothetical protein